MPTKIYFKEDNIDAGVRTSTATATINSADINSLGAIMSYASNSKLPAWLCAGLELYLADINGIEWFADSFTLDKNIDVQAWAREVLERGLPDFGDAWFIPGFIDNDELVAQTPSIAYAFVSYLNENGYLSEYIDNYGKLYYKDSETLTLEAWKDFSGIESDSQEESFSVHYLHNMFDYLDSLHERTIYIIYGKHGEYSFSRSDFWNHETAMNYAKGYDDGIAFASDWFDYQHHVPVKVFFYMSGTYGGGGAAYGGASTMTANGPDKSTYTIAAHDTLDMYAFVDVMAGAMLSMKESQYPYLNTYDTSASFLLYLKKKSSKEDLLRIYSDTSLMEEIYGKDLKGMIDE